MASDFSQPLELPRQYKKNIGRILEVKTSEEKIKGELMQVEDGEIVLQWKSREPKAVGKGKHTVQKEAILPLDAIVEAKVILIF